MGLTQYARISPCRECFMGKCCDSPHASARILSIDPSRGGEAAGSESGSDGPRRAQQRNVTVSAKPTPWGRV